MIEEASPLKIKPGYWSQVMFLVAGSAIMLYGIAFMQKNFFFIIYLFWFEQIIRVTFNYFRIRKAGKDLTELPKMAIVFNKHEFTLDDYNNRKYYARFYLTGNLFLLFTYWVFIIVMVGFVIPLSIDNNQMLKQNIIIMIFRDNAFLLVLLVFFAKLAADYRNDYILGEGYKKTDVLMVGTIFDSQNLVMHISLILGIGLWFMINRYLPAYSIYTVTVLATAFVIIKLIADIRAYNIATRKRDK